MPVLQASDIADLVNSTASDEGRYKITDLGTDLQDKVALSRMMRRGKVRFTVGESIKFNVLMNYDDNTRAVGLFNVDNVNQQDGTQVGEIPWRHVQTGFTYDVRQLAMNLSPAKIVDFKAEKKTQMLGQFSEKMEEYFWEEPIASTDLTTPYGVKYWFVYNAVEGFNGGNNANFASGPAGINRTTYTRWKNYTFNYTNVSKTDFIRKARKARWSCNFRPSIQNPPIASYHTGQRYGQYTTYDTLALLEEAAEDQNDRLGPDVASMDGRVTLGRVGVEAIPYLQSNEATPDPFLGIDWGTFKCVFLKNRYMAVSPLKEAPNQHNVVQSFLDCSFNWVCYDCRRNFLGAKSTWH